MTTITHGSANKNKTIIELSLLENFDSLWFTCLFQEHGGCWGPVHGAENGMAQMFKDALKLIHVFF